MKPKPRKSKSRRPTGDRAPAVERAETDATVAKLRSRAAKAASKAAKKALKSAEKVAKQARKEAKRAIKNLASVIKRSKNKSSPSTRPPRTKKASAAKSAKPRRTTKSNPVSAPQPLNPASMSLIATEASVLSTTDPSDVPGPIKH